MAFRIAMQKCYSVKMTNTTKRRPPVTAAIAVRVTPALKAAIKRAAKRIGMRAGEFIRLTLMAAVRS